MSQIKPSYQGATGKAEMPIINELVNKYGEENICWPILLSNNHKPICYLYEINKHNKTNINTTNIPRSTINLPSFKLNYECSPRTIDPYNSYFEFFLDSQYECSYDYILSTPESLNTLDLDYVWFDGERFKGFELTTFYVPFDNPIKAKNIVSKINRRPSWQGGNGASAFHKIVDTALDLDIDFYLVCVNTIDKVSSPLKTDGNVLLIPMTHEQVDLLSRGLPPSRYKFMSFFDFLDWI